MNYDLSSGVGGLLTEFLGRILRATAVLERGHQETETTENWPCIDRLANKKLV